MFNFRREREGIPQGLKPHSVAGRERAKAEALAYLEATAHRIFPERIKAEVLAGLEAKTCLMLPERVRIEALAHLKAEVHHV
jgi:hypothetical protein